MLQVKTDFRSNSFNLEGECFMTYPNTVTERWVEKNEGQPSFLNLTSKCLETDETLFRVFDTIAAQNNNC